MRSINLGQLRTLIEVVTTGSFSAAARRLNLTQPAVSIQIRDLEKRFGVQLIERMGKHAHPTVPGNELIEHARRIFRDCDVALSAMQRFRDGWIGSVHIGATLTAVMYELPPILRRLRAVHPGVELKVANMPTRDSVESVLQNKIDLALVTLPVENAQLRITPLRPEMLVAILPADTKNVPDVVTPEYLARQPLVLEFERGAVHALVLRWLAKHLPLPRAPMLMGTIEVVKKGVASSLGMSIVPDISVADPSPDYIVRPLDPPMPCTLGLIEHRSKPNDPALDIVRTALLTLREGPQAGPVKRSGKRRRAVSKKSRIPA